MATKAPVKKSAPAPAPAAKKAPAAAAKKPAPAPAPAPEEEQTVEVAEGSSIRFLGYGDDVPDDQRFLVDGETYVVAGFTEPEGDDPGGDVLIAIENPDFNPKKKESDENPKTMMVSVLPEEYEVVSEEEAEEVPAAEEEVVEEAKPAAKGKTKAAAPAKETATSKKAPPATKKAAPKAEEVAEEPEVDEDSLPDLEGEDEEVLALVNGETDLIEVAQQLEAQAATSEYRLGGVLYHIKKDKSYLALEGGEGYGEKGGFALFLKDYFNVEYRKAMYLIDIYVAFTLAQIENPAEAVARMGWAKASKIARPMMAEDANVSDLVQLASENTLADLSEALKEQVQVGEGGPGKQKVTRITLKFRFVEEEGASITAILEAYKEAHGLKDIGEALSGIVNEWQSQNAPAAAASTAPTQRGAIGKKPTAAPVKKGIPAKKTAKA